MKKALLVLALALTPSCRTLEAVAGVPAAVVSDVSSGVGVLTPSEQAVVDTAGAVATTGGTAVAGPAGGAAAGALATFLAQWLLKRRKKPSA